jgi:hypothetical protein
LSLHGQPDERKRIVPDTSVGFLVEEDDEHMIFGTDVLLSRFEYSHLEVVNVNGKLRKGERLILIHSEIIEVLCLIASKYLGLLDL